MGESRSNGKKSQHEVHTVYKKAPQRMLKFYEQHLYESR